MITRLTNDLAAKRAAFEVAQEQWVDAAIDLAVARAEAPVSGGYVDRTAQPGDRVYHQGAVYRVITVESTGLTMGQGDREAGAIWAFTWGQLATAYYVARLVKVAPPEVR
jgi:hypothetical protein